MKKGQKGFTLIELLIASAIAAVTVGAASLALYQIFSNTERSTSFITAVNQLENVGFWVNRDAKMAIDVSVAANLTPPEFLSFTWTEWDVNGVPTYSSANYTFENMVNGVGDLYRDFGSSTGNSSQTLVAKDIYYNPSDPEYSSNATYNSSVLNLKITSSYKGIMKTRYYLVTNRPGL